MIFYSFLLYSILLAFCEEEEIHRENYCLDSSVDSASDYLFKDLKLLCLLHICTSIVGLRTNFSSCRFYLSVVCGACMYFNAALFV